LLRSRGHHAARRLVDRLHQQLEPQAQAVDGDAEQGDDF